MINTGFGIVELLVVLLIATLSLGLPIAILVFLYKIYTKLKDIEEQMKKD